jgi:hypothetical protein
MCPRASPVTASSGCCRRSIFEFPRRPTLSASPAAQLRVSPKLERHRRRFRCLPGHPRVLHPPAVAMGIVRVAPHFLVHRQCRLVDLQASPDFTPTGRSVSASPGCPVFAATAGSMMSPRLCSNFASSGLLRATSRVSPLQAPAGCAADESSSSTGSCNPCLTPRCNLNLCRSSARGKPLAISRFLCYRIFLPGLDCNPRFT